MMFKIAVCFVKIITTDTKLLSENRFWRQGQHRFLTD